MNKGSALCPYKYGEEDSPGVLVVVVAVVEEAGAVETERGGWEVGGTAEDEEEGEGKADIHGNEPSETSPNFLRSLEHVHTLSSSTVAGWGLVGCRWAGHMMAGTGVLFV